MMSTFYTEVTLSKLLYFLLMFILQKSLKRSKFHIPMSHSDIRHNLSGDLDVKTLRVLNIHHELRI